MSRGSQNKKSPGQIARLVTLVEQRDLFTRGQSQHLRAELRANHADTRSAGDKRGGFLRGNGIATNHDNWALAYIKHDRVIFGHLDALSHSLLANVGTKTTIHE